MDTQKCPQCGATLRADVTSCWLCYASLVQPEPSSAPFGSAFGGDPASPRPFGSAPSSPFGSAPFGSPVPRPPVQTFGGAPAYLVIRRIADYLRWSGIAWLCLAVFQIAAFAFDLLPYATPALLVIGIWNLNAARCRLQLASAAAQRHAGVPYAFRGVAGLAVIGVINLLLGGWIGVVLVASEFFLRDQVLKHAAVFDNVGARAA